MRQRPPITQRYGAPHGLTQELCARAEDLCGRIAASDLAGRPVFVVLASQIGQAVSVGHLGATCGWLHWCLRQDVGERWTPEGNTLLIQDLSLWRDVRDLARRHDAVGRWIDRGAHFRKWFFAIVLHELVHVAGLPRESLAGRAAHARKGKPAELVAWLRDSLVQPPSESAPAPPELRPWVDSNGSSHGIEFIRVYLHLAARADRLGCPVDIDYAAAGDRYGLSLATRYAIALRPELCEYGAGRPLRDLAGLEPPRAFTELWNDDITKFET